MSDAEPFIQEIREHQHDEMPRLIYADYLEEAGDPLAELIRTQCELANLEPGDAARMNLNARERELLDEHADEWLQPLRNLGAEGISDRCFQRGLIERVRMPAATWLENGAELCRIAPAVYCVELRQPQDTLTQLASASFPEQITEVDLSANRLEAEAMAALRSAPWIQQLTSIDLQFNRLADEGVGEFVLAAPVRLERLNLSKNRIGPSGVQAIAESPMLGHIQSLSLNLNTLGDVGVQMLAASRYASNLRHLELASNGITSRGSNAIAESSAFPALRRLNLRANRIGDASIDALKDSPNLLLDELDDRGNSTESY